MIFRFAFLNKIKNFATMRRWKVKKKNQKRQRQLITFIYIFYLMNRQKKRNYCAYFFFDDVAHLFRSEVLHTQKYRPQFNDTFLVFIQHYYIFIQ